MSQEIDSTELKGDLSVAATLSELGWLRSDELPYIAADALARGQDSSTLRELAGTSRIDATEVGSELLARAMAELELEPASHCTARLAVARPVAAAILNGSITERVGTRRIYIALGDWGDDECAQIKVRWLEFDDAFDRLMYDIPAHRPDLDQLQRSVRDAAAALVEATT
jgi:hypothetical protein